MITMEPTVKPLPKQPIDILTSTHVSYELAKIVVDDIIEQRKQYGTWLPYSLIKDYPDITRCIYNESGGGCPYCLGWLGHIPSLTHRTLLTRYYFVYDPIVLIVAAVSADDRRFETIMDAYNNMRSKHEALEIPNLIYVLCLLGMEKRAGMIAYRTACDSFTSICIRFPCLFSVLINHDREFSVTHRDVFGVLNAMTQSGAEEEIERYVTYKYDPMPFNKRYMEKILSYLPPELRFTSIDHMKKL